MYFVFFKQKSAYEMRISDWSSDVCSSDLHTIGTLSRVVGGRDWKGNDGDSLRRDAAMQRPDTHPSPKLEPAVKADEPVVSRPAEDGLQLAGRYPAEDLPLQPV